MQTLSGRRARGERECRSHQTPAEYGDCAHECAGQSSQLAYLDLQADVGTIAYFQKPLICLRHHISEAPIDILWHDPDLMLRVFAASGQYRRMEIGRPRV